MVSFKRANTTRLWPLFLFKHSFSEALRSIKGRSNRDAKLFSKFILFQQPYAASFKYLFLFFIRIYCNNVDIKRT